MESLQETSLAACVVACITISIGLIVFCSCWYQLSVGLKEEEAKMAGNLMVNIRRSIRFLALYSLMAIMSAIFVIATYAPGAFGIPVNVLGCTLAFPKIYSATYVLANTSLYEFLRARSDLVSGVAESSTFLKYLRLLTNLAAKGVLATAVLCLALWGGEIVTQNGVEYCVDTINVILVVIFATLTLPISISFLLLFVWPLYHHYRAMQMTQTRIAGGNDYAGLLSVIRRNSFLSGIGLTSTVTSMAFIAISAAFYPSRIDFHIIGIAVADFDLTVNLTCMCLMFKQWIPAKFRNGWFENSRPTTAVVAADTTSRKETSDTLRPHDSSLMLRASPIHGTAVNSAVHSDPEL